MYWVVFVALIEDDVFVNTFGKLPVPFSIIFITISNSLPTLLILEIDGVIDEVIWVYTNSFDIIFSEIFLAYPIPSNVCNNWEPVATDGYKK